MVNKAYSFRLYPTKEQATLIHKTLGCSAELTQIKRELDWLREPDKFAIQNTLKHLSDSFGRFFKKQNQSPRPRARETLFNPTKRTLRTAILPLWVIGSSFPNLVW